MAKPIPEPTVAAAIPPQLDRIYFDEAATYPFQSAAVAYDVRNAWWMAEASFAAYDEFGPHGARRIDLGMLRSRGYDVTGHGNADVQLIAIEDERASILAFRGTRVAGFEFPLRGVRGVKINWADVVTDVRFLAREIAPAVLVHAGFLDAYRTVSRNVADIVHDAIAQRKTIWMCGHSLGAALATIAAFEHAARVRGLYTFGSPRVGDGRFAEALMREISRVCRFVHHRDVVTTVPPEGLPLVHGLDGLADLLKLHSHEYTHAGDLKSIAGGQSSDIHEVHRDSTDLLHPEADTFAHAMSVAGILASGLDIADLTTWPIAAEALADHSPVYYANKIFNACEKAHR